MPTYADLMAQGVRGENGLVQAFPPNTGVGWYTLATGTYPGEHGSTNNTFFRTGESNFNNRTAAFSAGVFQADTIAEAAQRAGKKVVSVEWAGGSRTATQLKGPVVDYRSFFSNRGLLLNYDIDGHCLLGQTPSAFHTRLVSAVALIRSHILRTQGSGPPPLEATPMPALCIAGKRRAFQRPSLVSG